MTDKEIIKALECCGKNHITGSTDVCEHCFLQNSAMCVTELIYKALDLINRQQAEIENLQADKEALINGQLTLQKDITFKQLQINNLVKTRHRKNEEISELNNLIKMLDQKLDTAKSEAIKEFAERLINNYATCSLASEISVDMVVCDIRRLEKEMVGEDK